MAISKITLNGVTQMDVTKKTVDANKMLDGITALKNDGTNVTGNIATKTSSDLTVSGATVTVPAGNYASDASASVAAGTATAPASISGTGASVSTGTNTLTLSKTISVTPNVSTAGYISSGTAGNSSVSLTASVNTQAAQTIYPSASDQTITAPKYLTGTQTIKGVTTSNLTAGNIKKGVVVKVGDSADDDRVTSVTGTLESFDGPIILDAYDAQGHSNLSCNMTFAQVQAYWSRGTAGGCALYVSTDATYPDFYYEESLGLNLKYSSGGSEHFEFYMFENATGRISVRYNYYSDNSLTVGDIDVYKKTLNVTENGTYTNPTIGWYETINVDVPTGGGVDGRLTQDPEGYLVLEEYGNGNRSLKDPIRFFDYNGEIVASYTSVPTELPTVPGHEGLKNGVWNYTLQEITTQFAASGTCDIGANYMTTSEKTEIDIEFVDDARLSPYLRFAVNGTVTIDWGDGSSPEDVTGTSLTTRKDIQHTYSQAGSYTITLTNTSGTYAMYSNGGTYLLLHNNSGTSSANRVYSNCVKAIRIGKNCSIGSYAFQYCYSLSSITIPSGVTSIVGSAFYGCYSLSSVTIPSDVTSIGNGAFYNCYSLSSITIPGGVTSIGSSAFQYCYSLSSITIPSGVTSIGSSAFYGCNSLPSITIPSSVTSIGSDTFNGCSSFSSITIPSGVTSIGSNAFTSCYSLSTITIPSGVTSVGGSAFSYCHSLSSITIPSGVTSIGNSAFYQCYGMKEYHFEPITPPTLGTTAFNNIQSDCIIYVPRSSGQAVLNTYKTATNWSDWASYIQEEPA